MILFGVHSPIALEYEESCARLMLSIRCAVNISDNPVLLAKNSVIELESFEPVIGERFLGCAFRVHRRAKLVDLGRGLGLKLASALIDPSAILAESVWVGDGTFINSAAVIGAKTSIGDACLISRTVSIGHNCSIADLVSIGPGATIASGVELEKGVQVGTGAILLPGVKVGSNSVIGAGALVREYVPGNSMVVGNPARQVLYDPKRHSYSDSDEE